MAATASNYVFLPWVRQGMVSEIPTPDSLGATQAGRVSVPVKLRINNASVIERRVRLYGPGDVIGIDRQQVIRTEPRHLTTAFEPNYFPAIEFDRPDFPWLFTPAKAGTNGKLRPWLCLVVVQKQQGVVLQTERGLPLPMLTITGPARPERELPDLSESWAWAHAQVTGSDRNDLKAALAGDPALTVSRLLCPRRLDPTTDYYACVVPAFELGRLAGLGLPIEPGDEKRLEPAWTTGVSEVTLPVYYHWEFRTGTGGDFEQLVRLLKPCPMPQEVGKRRMDISKPGFKITPELGTILELEGALRVSKTPVAEWPPTTRIPFQETLATILSAPWQAMKEGMEAEQDEPLLAPPIYGCWQAARHTVELTPEPPAPPPSVPWLLELNLDPRHRAIAGLGTLVVQDQQEQLMASAWEQLGEIKRINQLRRQAQLGRAVNRVYYARTFQRLPEETLLRIAASAKSRTVIGRIGANQGEPRALLSRRIAQSAIPDRAVSGTMRRLTSPRGAISVRFQTPGAPPTAFLARFNAPISIVSFQRKPAGWVTIDEVSNNPQGQFVPALKDSLRFELISRALDSKHELRKFRISAEGDASSILAAFIALNAQPPPPDRPDGELFRRTAQAHQDYISHRIFGTTWRDSQFVFSGGNRIIYSVDHMGRLRFSRDQSEDRRGDFSSPSIIGLGGWQGFSFLFSGGDGILYALAPSGLLFLYRDETRDGTGDVANPKIINQSHDPADWKNFKFVFSGGNGIIYALETSGRLRFYRDEKRDGTGQITNAKFINNGDWKNFKFLFSGGSGTLYAVDEAGKLLFFRDETQDGTGVVTGPAIIGEGGWDKFKFIFSGGDGIICAIDHQGRLLATRDETQDGTGSVALPADSHRGGTSPNAPPLDLANTKVALLRSLDPERTITARVQASLVLSGAFRQTPDPLEPILDEPDFPQPMYEALRDLSQDWIFPGLEHVPPDSITLLETNKQFVESFLVGLNAEMSHELLWRGYPTDQRGTYFRQFWDSLEDDDKRDIPMIRDWGDRKLGENAHTGEALVLLLRGELLRRYPNSVIYAVKAKKIGEHLDLSEVESHPLFRGTLFPDVTFLGFPPMLTRDEAIGNEASGNPGWFFVIQEQPTEPRFGMDVPDFSANPLPKLTSWDDLSWRYLAETEAEFKALSHASLNPVPQKIADLSLVDKTKWGRNAAHQAFITLQRPVRIAIHAKQLLPSQ